jgi:hypothetical protein
MKDELNVPLLREEDFVAANLRRDNYSLKRDLQAQEFNDAIVSRMVANQKNKLKCSKCGKEYEAGVGEQDLLNCPDCR